MMKWVDEHLTWDPSSYSAISAVRFRPKDVWIPDIQSLYNVKAMHIYDQDHGTPVQVFSNGTVKWYPPSIFDVPCGANYRHYPFDVHNCSVLLGAWSHGGNSIMLEIMEIPMKPLGSAESTEWLLWNVSHVFKMYDLTKEVNYPMVNIVLSLERVSRLYRYICIVPTLITLVSSLCGFWLMSHETSRYLIGCSNVILTSLLLQHLAITVPAGKDIPLIAQYSAACLCMSAAFLLVTVFTHLLKQSSSDPPIVLLRIAHHHLWDRYLCLSIFFHSSTKEQALEEVGSPENLPPVFTDEDKRKKDWAIVSLLVDRIALAIFSLIYVALIAVLSCI